jgi:hypothetical protein
MNTICDLLDGRAEATPALHETRRDDTLEGGPT